MPIQDYSTDPDLNVQISGINIAEGCPPSGINNAIRQLMADVKEESEAKAEAIAAAATQASSALEAYAEGQVQKDAAQDEAIAEAKSSAEAASEDVTALDTALRQLIADELKKYLPLAGGNVEALTVAEQNIVRTVNGVAADAAGNVAIEEVGTDYIRYTNGVQMVWGGLDLSILNSTNYTVTLPVPFVHKDKYVVMITRVSGATTTMVINLWAHSYTTTSFNIRGTAETGAEWVAVGNWK